MAADNINPNPSNSSNQEISFISKASQMLSALDLKEPIYGYTLLVICLAVLFQVTLRSRKRIRRLEAEFQEFARARRILEGGIEALREEMRSSREVDREEKLCLVENVKQVLRQGNGSPREGNGEDEIYIDSHQQNDAAVTDGKDYACEQQNDDAETPLEDTSCPWCSHAHLLRLGGCAGDDTCDGSVHIPYCPSCFYNGGIVHGQGQDTICLDGGAPAAEMTNGKASAKLLDN